MKDKTTYGFGRELTGEAILEYSDGEFMTLKPGSYVVCAVTGTHIPIDELRYWNPILQEAYRDGVIATLRWQELNKTND